ncbi:MULTISPECIES: hypothetical protein [Pseudomonas syringae group]|uniref:hypothetical protein n=1 Tax=Pseudomonas syringae group TaxID=136849 RepID=UPI0011C48E95|nr:hypothetical protein [Pseudomonas syringae group genomosp. 3]
MRFTEKDGKDIIIKTDGTFWKKKMVILARSIRHVKKPLQKVAHSPSLNRSLIIQERDGSKDALTDRYQKSLTGSPLPSS